MRCLIVDDVHSSLIETLENRGVEVIYRPDSGLKDVISIIGDVEILVIRSKFYVGREVLQIAPALQWIARAGAGLDNIDASEADLRKIELIHAAEGNADAVAEHTVGMMLGLLARIPSASQSVKSGEWNRERFRGLELKGRTVGLLGYGNMGRAVASRLVSFGCMVLAYDKYLQVWPDQNAQPVTLETLFSQADILSLHIPLTEETRGMVSADFLRNFKKGLFLINTSRGSVLPLEGIPNLLDEGQLAGVGLDVLEEEPPVKKNGVIPSKYERLFGRDDVLLTPHVAGWSLESYEKISRVLGSKILDRINRVVSGSRE